MAKEVDISTDLVRDDELAYKTNAKVFAGGLCSQDMVQYYDRWAADGGYDMHLNRDNNVGPAVVAEAVDRCFSAEEKLNVRVLDVAAGTGRLGAELYERGFRHIDALDPSTGMLDKAKERGIYENFINSFIGFESPVPVRNDAYDVLTVCGGFGEGHIPCNALTEMIRVVKPGGIICFAVRQEYLQVPQYKGILVSLMQNLEENGRWKLKYKTTLQNFAFGKPGYLYQFIVT